MKTTESTQRARAGWGRRPHLALGALALTLLAACNSDKLVNLDNPDLITGTVARDTANINELRNGVIYEFDRAMTGPAANNATPGIVGISAVMTDEMWYSSTFTTMQDIDRRNVTTDNGALLTVYQYLHRARNGAEQAAVQFTNTTRNNTADHALLTNYAGYAYVFFAENFCSGVPFSATDFNGNLTFGKPYTTAQMLDSAIARFDQAIARATAAGSNTQLNTARVGKARALLAKGDFAGAAAVAAQVPAGFQFTVDYSANSSGQNNGVWYNNNSEKRSSVASGEGANGLVFFRRGPKVIVGPAGDTVSKTNTIDPRTPADSLGLGIGGTIPLYANGKYTARQSPVVLASSTEARLIEAEAALNKGNSNAYLTNVNALRAGYGLAPLVDPVTPDARVRQFFQERAFFLWLTGHRLGDLRRMVKFYGYPQANVFPTGQTIFGAPYGNDVNFPIPQQEQNNPEFANGSCIDRNA